MSPFPSRDRQNARVVHNKALGRAMTDVLKDDTELFKQFTTTSHFAVG